MPKELCGRCNGSGMHAIGPEIKGLQQCVGCDGAGYINHFASQPIPVGTVALAVKIKRLHPDAVMPTYAKDGDAGLDLTATDNGVDTFPADQPARSYYYREYGTGIAVEIPAGYVGLIFPRSSISKTCLSLSNCVGVIDSGYRGEIKFRFKIDGFAGVLKGAVGGKAYEKGDKIGQLIVMPYPQVVLEEVEELSDSERGTGGFGSTGA